VHIYVLERKLAIFLMFLRENETPELGKLKNIYGLIWLGLI
jgi:hypothetical protein